MRFVFRTGFILAEISLLILTIYLDNMRQIESRAYMLSFVSTRTGTREVYTMTAVGTDQHQLSQLNLAIFSYPKWDDKQNCINYDQFPYQYCMYLDGHAHQEYAEGGTPSLPTVEDIGDISSSTVTPDHAWFVVGTEQGVFRVRPDGSDLAQLTLTPAQTVVYVAENKHILFKSPQGISVISVDGQDEHHITDEEIRLYLTQASPDGQWLVLPLVTATYPDLILLYNLNTSQEIYLVAYAYQLNWTDDGQYLIYAVDNHVYIYDLPNDIIRIASIPYQSGYGGFAFYGLSPDKETLLLKINENLYVMRLDTSDPVILTRSDQLPRQVKDANNHILTRNNLNAQWSPDGEWIVFQSELQYGTSDIYVVRPDGTDLQNLTNNPNWDIEPSWLPAFEKSWHQSQLYGGALMLLSFSLVLSKKWFS